MGIVVCFAGPAFVAAQSLTPKSAEVQQAVQRGVTFLEANSDPRLGAQALSARVMLALEQREHPLIARAIAAIHRDLAAGREIDIYSLGLSLLFLVEWNIEKERGAIEQLLRLLEQRQKQSGGWGYSERATTDNSMSQFAVLGMWAADDAGFALARDFWVRTLSYYLRVQDPSGSFGYQAVEPTAQELVPQVNVSTTLTYASLASMYLCGERLGLVRFTSLSPPDSLPVELRRVEVPSTASAEPVGEPAIPTPRFRAAVDRALAWYRTHPQLPPEAYHFYFFYTLERLETIRDSIRGRDASNAEWYPNVARGLLGSQRPDGSWYHTEGAVPATSFALLTLLRSTQKVLEKKHLYGSGTLISGRGLPGGSSPIELRQGKAVSRPLTGPAEELFAKLAERGEPEFDRALDTLEDLVREAELARLTPLAQKLRALAAEGPVEARAAALRGLARTRDFDDVPLFIEALEAPEPEIFRAADDGLRRLSRRLGMPPLSQALPDVERGVVKRRWLAWYRDVFPERTGR